MDASREREEIRSRWRERERERERRYPVSVKEDGGERALAKQSKPRGTL